MTATMSPWTGCQHCGWRIDRVVSRSCWELEAEVAEHQKTCPAYLAWVQKWTCAS